MVKNLQLSIPLNKLPCPHPSFDPHLEASAQRDNVKVADKIDSKNPLFKLSLSKDAVRRFVHTTSKLCNQ